jgi:hypothetical protein
MSTGCESLTARALFGDGRAGALEDRQTAG